MKLLKKELFPTVLLLLIIDSTAASDQLRGENFETVRDRGFCNFLDEFGQKKFSEIEERFDYLSSIRPTAKVKNSPQDFKDNIKNLLRFGVAVKQEIEGQHSLANFNYNLAFENQFDEDFRSNSIDEKNDRRFEEPSEKLRQKKESKKQKEEEKIETKKESKKQTIEETKTYTNQDDLSREDYPKKQNLSPITAGVTGAVLGGSLVALALVCAPASFFTFMLTALGK